MHIQVLNLLAVCYGQTITCLFAERLVVSLNQWRRLVMTTPTGTTESGVLFTISASKVTRYPSTLSNIHFGRQRGASTCTSVRLEPPHPLDRGPRGDDEARQPRICPTRQFLKGACFHGPAFSQHVLLYATTGLLWHSPTTISP